MFSNKMMFSNKWLFISQFQGNISTSLCGLFFGGICWELKFQMAILLGEIIPREVILKGSNLMRAIVLVGVLLVLFPGKACRSIWYFIKGPQLLTSECKIFELLVDVSTNSLQQKLVLCRVIWIASRLYFIMTCILELSMLYCCSVILSQEQLRVDKCPL